MTGRKTLLRRLFEVLVDGRSKQVEHQIERYLGRNRKGRVGADELTSR